MSEAKMQVHLPVLPAPEIFNDPERTIMTSDNRALLTYDPATRASFIYAIEQRRWTIMAPVDFNTFAMMAAVSGYEVADTADARRWLAACNADSPAPDVVVH